MGVYAAVIFSLLFGIVIGEEAFICNSDDDSLVPVTIFVTAEQYHACKEDNDCTFDSQCVTLDNSEKIHDTFQGRPYFEICRKIHYKMEQLEAEHPELKHLKLKVLQLINTFVSEFELETSDDELVSTKILDFVKNSVEKMKVELESKKMHKPEPIPILKPIIQEEEVTAEPEVEHEPDNSMLVGSIRGIPGIHFPNYTEIPITSFSCSDKTIIPGFYADLETGCQVFHLCYEHRRESFLCPIGTIFNQPILACDYWYSANCSQAPIYYEDPNIPEPESITIVDPKKNVEQIAKHPEKDVLKDFMKFIPVKAKVTDIPTSDKQIEIPDLKPSVILEDTEAVADKIFDGILSLGNHFTSVASNKLKQLPDPKYEVPLVPKFEHLPLKTNLATKAAFVPLAKAKKITAAAKLSAAVKVASGIALTSGKVKLGSLAAAAALPIKAKKAATAAVAAAALPIKAKKAAVAAAALPIKAKKAATAAVAAAALPIKAKKVVLPIVKTKLASASIPLVKAKAVSKKLPIVKAKLLALPLAKTKFGAASIPALKAKKAVKVAPFLKMAALKPKIAIAPLKAKSAVVLPLMKAKLAKAAVSPLTKKTLALGYLKLLKAKKLALMG